MSHASCGPEGIGEPATNTSHGVSIGFPSCRIEVGKWFGVGYGDTPSRSVSSEPAMPAPRDAAFSSVSAGISILPASVPLLEQRRPLSSGGP